jgi:hypothetical protein
MLLRTRHSPFHATFIVVNRFVDVFKAESGYSAFEVAPDGLAGFFLGDGQTEDDALQQAHAALTSSQS